MYLMYVLYKWLLKVLDMLHENNLIHYHLPNSLRGEYFSEIPTIFDFILFKIIFRCGRYLIITFIVIGGDNQTP